jgi:hypothetical protein
MNRRWIVGSLAAAAVGATCGGDGSSFSSGVDKGAQLGSLSAGDAQKLCDSLSTWTKDNFAPQIKEITCRFAGFLASSGGSGSAAEKQAACTTTYDQCMKQPAQETGTATCEKPSTSCKATVGEYESCINDMAPMVDQFLSAIPTCAQAGSGGTVTPPTNIQPPASCTTVQSKCAELDLPGVPGAGD